MRVSYAFSLGCNGTSLISGCSNSCSKVHWRSPQNIGCCYYIWRRGKTCHFNLFLSLGLLHASRGGRSFALTGKSRAHLDLTASGSCCGTSLQKLSDSEPLCCIYAAFIVSLLPWTLPNLASWLFSLEERLLKFPSNYLILTILLLCHNFDFPLLPCDIWSCSLVLVFLQFPPCGHPLDSLMKLYNYVWFQLSFLTSHSLFYTSLTCF